MKTTFINMILILCIKQIGYSQGSSIESASFKTFQANKSIGAFPSLKNTARIDYNDCLDMYIFAQDSKEQYLGKITPDKYDSESIINEFGDYGSKYSSTSILNEFGDYGSILSSYSAYNEFASSPPVICKLENDSYITMAYLTKNTLKSPALDPDVLISTLKSEGFGQNLSPSPDLMAFSVWISETDYYIGDSVTINYSIFNNSSVDINNTFFTSIKLDTTVVKTNRTTSIASKTSIHGSGRAKIASNTRFIVISTDYTSLISESNESNNRTSLVIHPNSPTTRMGQIYSEKSLLIYPNPINSDGCLYVESESTFFRITVYDSHGKLIFDKPMVNNFVDLAPEAMNKGLYLVKLFDGEVYVEKKIVIN